MTEDEIVKWVRNIMQYEVPVDECLDMHRIYMLYRAEGQSIEVSKQYAGLL